MFNIPYIIATRNRLPYLRILLSHILPQLLPDEELVIVDGNSSDGTRGYLLGLYQKGDVHQFISEPDHNQGHAWNKAILMAKGSVIKKLIDDDVHDLPAIRLCCQYMLDHPETDFCISNCLGVALNDPGKVSHATRLSYFLKWKSEISPSFTFSDVSMLIRRSSLSRSGLFDTQIIMIDWEFSLRISFLKMNIVYFTGYNALTVATPGNVTSTATQAQFHNEEKLGKLKYNYPGDRSDISLYSKVKIHIGSTWSSISKQRISETGIQETENLSDTYARFYDILRAENQSAAFEFIA